MTRQTDTQNDYCNQGMRAAGLNLFQVFTIGF